MADSSNGKMFATGLAAAGLLAALPSLGQEAQRPNVLFIAVDDLRPQLGCYGHEQIKSPNIDRLAGGGLLFERAYCQQAICMASRASLLSGYRPDKGRIYKNGALFTHVPDALSLNQHFMNNGYEAVAMGKIYHHESDYENGWSRPWFKPKGEWEGRGYLDEESKRIVREYPETHPNEKRKGMGPAFEAPDVPDNAYADGMTAEHAIQELNRLKGKPFFMAVGFAKPHLPFNAPKKYWDVYSEDDIKLTDNPLAPAGALGEALTNWGELRGYVGMPKKGPMPEELARQLIHGYYACVSYTDAMIGKVLDELDRLGLADNTIVVLWGDHGWKLGDYGMWCKHTTFEIDTHAPLIIRASGMAAEGRKTASLVEFVDIYPTLAELCGLDLPEHLQGASMAPLLTNPEQPWKSAAFSQWPSRGLMGYSIRSGNWRYTEWIDIKTGDIKDRELYDHSNGPLAARNQANDPALTETVSELSRLLDKGQGWKAVRTELEKKRKTASAWGAGEFLLAGTTFAPESLDYDYYRISVLAK
ncbi:MAG: sulfatase [Lentisphaeria bacterium]|nr:sulfatase [Lentisphaeria bacterium]